MLLMTDRQFKLMKPIDFAYPLYNSGITVFKMFIWGDTEYVVGYMVGNFVFR